MIKVAIVEDDVETRELFSSMLKLDENFVFIGDYNSSEQYLENLHQIQADVVIMDIHLPEKSGIECIKEAKPLFPNVQYIIFSVFEDDDNIFEALRAGATGYLLKSTSPSGVFEAIRNVYEGGSPISPSIARRVISNFQKVEPKETDSLTKREKEILQALSKGMRYKEISDTFFISMDTVRSHIRHIYEKLQVNSRTDALNKAFGTRIQ